MAYQALDDLAADFEPYRPCRWTLECLRQATTVARHTAHADSDGGTGLGDVDVCAAHAAERQQWRSDNQGRPARNWTWPVQSPPVRVIRIVLLVLLFAAAVAKAL